jgi:peptidoglycan/xylan/chitin deacetylase (PgdA/CDA1 family)
MNVQASRWLRYALALCAHYSGMDFLYRTLSGPGLVILMLHRLRDTHDPYPLSTTRPSFRRMLRWLRHRQALVGLDEGLQALAQRSRRIHYAVTFDDGYRDNLRLIDDEFGRVPAVLYIVTDHMGGEPIWVYRLTHAVESRTCDHIDLGFLGLGHFDLSDLAERERLYLQLPPRLKQLRPEEVDANIDTVIAQARPTTPPEEQRDMLDWKDVRRLHAHGIEIGAHTCNHVLLSLVDDDTARAEIMQSAARILGELATPPRHFAYPNGGAADFGDRDVQLVRDAGFATATTSIEGVNRPGTDPYRLLRHNVHEQRFLTPWGHLSKALFFSETSGLLGWLRNRRAA